MDNSTTFKDEFVRYQTHSQPNSYNIIQHKKTYVSKHLLYITLIIVSTLLALLLYEIIEVIRIIKKPFKKVSELTIDLIDFVQIFKDILRIF